MKKSLYLFFCLVLAIAMLVACDPSGVNPGNGDHEHTYAEEWSFNATGHWYAATCDHTDELGSYAVHADANYDGACDVCAWYDTTHTHTYSEAWSYDADNHWHVVTCEHTGLEVSAKAAHADENKNGVCDVCNYVICSHTYSELWETNDNYHWNDASCGCEVTGSYGAHVDEDANENCDVCHYFIGEVNENEILSVLRASAAKRGALNGGVVKFTNVDGSVTDITYVYGVKDTYIHNNYVTRGATQELWLNRLADDTVFAVVSENGGEIAITTVSLEQMNGYNYNPSTLTSSDTLEGLLLNLYNLSQEKTATGFVESHDAESNSYAFSFNYLAVNYVTYTDSTTGQKITNAETGYFEVDAAFSYTDNFVITGATLVVDAYSSIDLEEGEDQDDLSTVLKDYTVLDIENGIVKLEDGATKDRYTYDISQSIGERTYENPYAKVKILPTNFDLYLDPARDQSTVYTATDAKGNTLKVTVNGFTSIITLAHTSVSDPASYAQYKYSVVDGAIMLEHYTGVVCEMVFDASGNLTSVTWPSIDFTYDKYKEVNGATWPSADATKTEEVYTNFSKTTSTVTLVGDKVYTKAGTTINLYIGNIVPTTALYKFITEKDFSLSVVYADNGEAYDVNRYYSTFTPGVVGNAYTAPVNPDNWNAVYVNADAQGRNLIFKITYHSPDGKDIIKELDIILGNAPEPEETVDKNVSGRSFKVKVTDIYNYVDEFIYTANAAGTYTFDLVDGETLIGFAVKSVYDAGGDPEVDAFDPLNEATSYTVELDKGESIVFYVGAIAKGIYTVDVTFVAN